MGHGAGAARGPGEDVVGGRDGGTAPRRAVGIAAAVAGALLALIFAGLGGAFLAGALPEPPDPPAGSAMAKFMEAMMPTGYMTFVKLFEVLGGLLIAIPRTRRLGLLVLGPIVVNILAFHWFIAGTAGLIDPMVAAVVVLVLFLAWVERDWLVRCVR